MPVRFGDVAAKAAQRGPALWQAGEGSKGEACSQLGAGTGTLLELHHGIWHGDLGLRLSAL